MAFAIFHIAHLGIVAEVVAAFHELVGLYRKPLFFAQAALAVKAFALPVDIPHRLSDEFFFLAAEKMEVGAFHCLLFRDAGTEAVLCQ